MNIFDFYSDSSKHEELKRILSLGAQNHPAGLAANFLEKDIWVTEILRLLYNENLIGDFDIAFKGGTSLSKCWNAIDRFSEDIDLSIHWADMAGTSDEEEAWMQSTKSNSQNKKFKSNQTKRLIEWSSEFVDVLNTRLRSYGIDGLNAKLEEGSAGEKIDVIFPRVTQNDNSYQLDHILLEFGARNRGRPTVKHDIDCYLSHIPELSEIKFPKATVQAYDPAYILWEKLTALHQFSTQTKEPDSYRLSRHWYDVDCILEKQLADPLNTKQAMTDVVIMKQARWSAKGVNYEEVLQGELQLVPSKERLEKLVHDHKSAVDGKMFFSTPSDFDSIIKRIKKVEGLINLSNK